MILGHNLSPPDQHPSAGRINLAFKSCVPLAEVLAKPLQAPGVRVQKARVQAGIDT